MSSGNEHQHEDGPQPSQKVGYGHPPKQHQFKPGQKPPGNGPAKGSATNRSILRKMLAKRLQIKEPGKQSKTITLREAILQKFCAAALSNPKLVIPLLRWEAQLDKRDASHDDLFDDLPPDLESLMAEFAKEKGLTPNGGDAT